MKAVRARGRVASGLEALGGHRHRRRRCLRLLAHRSGISTVGDFMGFVTALLLAAQPIKSLGSLSDFYVRGPGRGRAHLRAARREADRGRPARARGRSRSRTGRHRLRRRSASPTPRRRCSPAVKQFSLHGAGRQDGGPRRSLRLPASRPSSISWRRLFDVQSGRILIDGQDLRDVTLASFRRLRLPSSARR